jgi:hypothetical protein
MRRPEASFWQEFEEARPSILGALLDAVSLALRTHRSVKLPGLPRMADFAVWSAAAAPALGWSAEEFLTAYERNRSAVHEIAIEDSQVGHLILEIGRHGFSGTATELLKQLGAAVGETAAKDRGWPKTARALSGTLRRLAPNLRALGVSVDFSRETTGQKRRLVSLRPRGAPVTGVTRGAEGVPTTTGGDANRTSGDATDLGHRATTDRLERADEPHSNAGDASDASDDTTAHADLGADEAEVERLVAKLEDIVEGEA